TGQFRLHRGRQTGPIPVIINGRSVIVRITVRIAVIIIGVPPIRKSEGDNVEAKKESAMVRKEMIVYAAADKPIVAKCRARTERMTVSNSRGSMESAPGESSHLMTGRDTGRDRHQCSEACRQ